MITLREDQEQLRGKLRVSLRSSSSVLVFAPPGFGKTVLASALIQALFKAGKRTGFAVHRAELVTQTAGTLDKFGIPYSFVASGRHFNPYHRVYIISTPSMRNRLGKIPLDYLFVDEAHLSMSKNWQAMIDHYREAGTRIIGLSGSPERLDGKPLGDNFQDMVMGPSVADMIDAGRLARYRAFAPAGVDTSGLHVRNGEYVSSEVDALMSGKAAMSNAVSHWKKFAAGKRTIAFCPSVARSEQMAEEFRAQGVNAVHVDGTTERSFRRNVFADFADGKVDVLTNVGLFCEGFDLSAQVGRDVPVNAVLLYRPTQSLALHLQQVGRAMRPQPDPAIILDLVGNLSRLGLPDDEREWSLEGRKKAAREVKAMTCEVCFATHAPAPKCPECGTVYERAGATGGGRQIEEVDHDLEEIDIEARRQAAKVEQSQARSLADLVALAERRNYKQPKMWAAHVWSARMARGAA